MGRGITTTSAIAMAAGDPLYGALEPRHRRNREQATQLRKTRPENRPNKTPAGELASRTRERWEDTSRQFLRAVGARSGYAYCLWYDRNNYHGDGGYHTLHLRSSSFAQHTFCPDATDIRSCAQLDPAPRGAWAEPEKHGALSFKRCHQCEREAANQPTGTVHEEMRETADYPILPADQLDRFTRQLARQLADDLGQADQPTAGEARELADRTYRELLIDQAVELIQADPDAYKRLLGRMAHEALWKRLPRGSGRVGSLIPMPMSEFVPRPELRKVLARSLPASPDGIPVDWEQVRKQTSTLMSKRVRVLLARRDLELLDGDREEELS